MTSIIAYVQAHPILGIMLAVIAALAVVGLWYVIAHHLQAIIITLICGAGAASGAVVFWRGVTNDLTDLLAIGLFLLLIFPVIYLQAIRRERKPVQIAVTQVPGVVRSAAGPVPPRH